VEPVAPALSATSPPALTATVGAARAGDDDAFTALYRRFAPVAHGIALARLGRSDAEDVVQEVFLALHRNLARLRAPEALPGWIRTTTERACIDRMRRRGRETGAALDDVASPAPAPPRGDLAERVLACLQRLPGAYRETLVWRLVEGLTGPEIAARTGMTEGSVRVNLHRGLALLRPWIEKEGFR
jgi:RNA polymerase sigma-70 factor, ECF subfamily